MRIDTASLDALPAGRAGSSPAAATMQALSARGFGYDQVSSMLRNERYIGVVTWNKREFYRDPITRARVATGLEGFPLPPISPGTRVPVSRRSWGGLHRPLGPIGVLPA